MFRHGVACGAQSILTQKHSPEAIDAHAIFDAARDGDAFCLSIIDRMAWYLAKGFSAVATVLAPETFIVSGGLSREKELLWVPLQHYFYKNAYRSVQENVKLVLAELGESAPVIGAATLYRSPEYADDAEIGIA